MAVSSYLLGFSIYRYTASTMLGLVLLMLSKTFAAEFQKYQIENGVIQYGLSYIQPAETIGQCAALVNMDSRFHIGIYNKATLACSGFTASPQILYVQESDDINDRVIWGNTACSHFDHIFKVHADQDLSGGDSAHRLISTLEQCIAFCDQADPDFKAVLYSSGWDCYCKSLAKAEHLLEDLNKALIYQENVINTVQIQLKRARTFCQPHLVDECGPQLEQEWWESNLDVYLKEIDKLKLIQLQIKHRDVSGGKDAEI